MNKFLDLAIIIPTLNEEHYIGKLLDSIISQNIQPQEIVIVDAFSQDQTIEQIKKRQALLPQLKYFQIPKHTISKQRNYGVEKTKSDHLLFLDADMVLKHPDTLEKYYSEILQFKPDIATVDSHPDSQKHLDKGYFIGMYTVFKIMRPLWPIATGQNLYVKRAVFEKVKGFDPEVRTGEDMELLQRIIKNGGKFIVFKKPKLYTSVRRMEKEGRLKFTIKMVKALYFVQRYGFRKNPVEYEFGNHIKD